MSTQAEGTATLSLGENNFLTTHNKHAVVGLMAGTQWHIRAYKISEEAPPLFIILIKCEGSDDLCLTLDANAGENENNIMVEPLEVPRPKTTQLWTFEDAAVMERLPPIMLARIQSVARPHLSAAIGGSVPLPRLYQNIAGVPNEPGSELQRWRVDYMSVD